MSKFVDIICIESDGNLKLEKVKMIKTLTGLSIGKGNCSQGPEFYRIRDGIFYSYVLEYKSDDNIGLPHVFSNLFLDKECCCVYHTTCSCFAGNFYLSKHNPRLGYGKNLDFSKPISYEEFEKYDTTINCMPEDISFIESEINKRKLFTLLHKNWWKIGLVSVVVGILMWKI